MSERLSVLYEGSFLLTSVVNPWSTMEDELAKLKDACHTRIANKVKQLDAYMQLSHLDIEKFPCTPANARLLKSLKSKVIAWQTIDNESFMFDKVNLLETINVLEHEYTEVLLLNSFML
uniref:Uncharacterized protein n=1 Tax=Oryza punctata TaxID=4537 RepID=A0A0E0L558_ORYPU